MKSELPPEIQIKWCDCCKTFFVECPRCGNNSCNGGRGREANGRRCRKCVDVYALDELLNSEETANAIHKLLGKRKLYK